MTAYTWDRLPSLQATTVALSGIEVPAAANPILFVLGFIFGTTTLHLLGVVIGHFSIKKTLSLILLRISGISFAVYGVYLLSQIF